MLQVSEAWFYKWRRHPAEPTKREVRRMELEERVTFFFRLSGETYGSPRITPDLWAEGWKVSVNTVAEIMAGLGLQGRRPPRRRHSAAGGLPPEEFERIISEARKQHGQKHQAA